MAENSFIARIIRAYALPAGTSVTAYNSPLTGAVNLGEFSSDGVKHNRNRTTENVTTNNGGVVRTIVVDSEVTVGGTLVDDGPVVDWFLTGLVAVDGAITDSGRSSWRGGLVIDEIDDARADGSTKFVRYWFPNAETTATDERTANSGSAKQAGFTTTAYPANALSGGKYRKWEVVVAGPTQAVPTWPAGDGGSTPVDPDPVETDSIMIDPFGPLDAGGTYTVSGTSTKPNTAISVDIDTNFFATDGSVIDGLDENLNLTTDGDGNFSAGSFNVPADAQIGSTVNVVANFPGTYITSDPFTAEI